jgi:6-phosphofructokinase 1
MSKIKRIGVFTSGGDSSGMNACIRAVVRAAIYYDLEIYGIYHGYEGMIDGEIRELKSNSVSNIIQRGGTILKTARSQRFMTKEGMALAYKQLKKYKIDALVAIGGDGTYKGALEFSSIYKMSFIGLPGTIDNDLFGTDYTIGFDTAINTVVEAVDRIRDTADSHSRLFFVEVMGRDAGYIALHSGLACGAESILIPETKTHIDTLIETLNKGWKRKKTSSIVIVAEGDELGGAIEIAKMVNKRFKEYETRVTILGHLQRGGSPSCRDRVLASRLGVKAVESLMEGEKGFAIGIIDDKFTFTPFEKATKKHQPINKEFLETAKILSSV